MEETLYEIGTDEAAVKLGLSPRHVRRLGEDKVLEGVLEKTSNGKQWFFKAESVESLVKAREVKRKKVERHRTAQDVLSGVPGQPETTEVTSEDDRPPLVSDEKRVEALEDLLKQEQEAHEETREKLEDKLESKQAELLEASKEAAKLEGEKEAYEKYAVEMREHQRELVEILKNTPRLAQPSTTDNMGRDDTDDSGRPRPAAVTAEVVSEPKQHSSRDGEPELVGYTPPSETPHDDHHDDFTPPEVDTPSSGAEPHAGEDFAGEEVPPSGDYREGGGVVPTTSA